jgi:thiamine-phosphate pyrophosphorylase
MSAELYLIAPPDAEATAFGALLRPVLALNLVRALLLPRGGRAEPEYRHFVTEIAPIAQEAGCAVLIEGEPRLARALGVDGVHVEGSLAELRAAIAALKPDLIVGTGGVMSRHDAMTRGELDPDYIMFGPLSGAIGPAAREMAGWWAQAMVVPSVLSDPEATAATANAEGCEFFAASASVWEADDPAAALAAIATALEGHP